MQKFSGWSVQYRGNQEIFEFTRDGKQFEEVVLVHNIPVLDSPVHKDVQTLVDILDFKIQRQLPTIINKYVRSKIIKEPRRGMSF